MSESILTDLDRVQFILRTGISPSLHRDMDVIIQYSDGDICIASTTDSMQYLYLCCQIQVFKLVKELARYCMDIYRISCLRAALLLLVIIRVTFSFQTAWSILNQGWLFINAIVIRSGGITVVHQYACYDYEC